MSTSSPTLSGASPRTTAPAGRLVHDAPTRVFHWLLAFGFLGAWLTGDSERWRALHVTLGYTLAGLLVFRVVYGLIGPRPLRLGVLWRKLQGAPRWLLSLRQPGASWRSGAPLLLAGSVAAVLAGLAPLLLSGYAVHDEWTGDWMEEVHEFLGNLLLAVVLLHLAAIALLSLLRRRNHALSMLTGRIPGPGPDVVRQPRRGLALALVLAAVSFVAWQWQRAPDGLVPAGAFAAADRHRPGQSGVSAETAETGEHGVHVPHRDHDDHGERPDSDDD